MSPPLLLRNTCANYLLSQLHNQAFASTFPMGPYVKLECAVQEAFLMDSPESGLGCSWAYALLSCMCHQGANPHCGAFGVCCPSPTQLLGRTLNPGYSVSPLTGTPSSGLGWGRNVYWKGWSVVERALVQETRALAQSWTLSLNVQLKLQTSLSKISLVAMRVTNNN